MEFGHTNGPLAFVSPIRQRIVFDLDHLDADHDMTVAFIVALLDLGDVWPLSRHARDRASQLAHRRLGRATVSSIRSDAPIAGACDRQGSGEHLDAPVLITDSRPGARSDDDGLTG